MQELKRALVLTFPFGGESTSSALSTLISRINDVAPVGTAFLCRPDIMCLPASLPQLLLCVHRLNANCNRRAHVKHTVNSLGATCQLNTELQFINPTL